MTTKPVTPAFETLEAAAPLFAALAEDKRLGILATLASGERCACDLTGCCGDRQPLLSFHLRKLRDAGLVEARREGRWMHYSLRREALMELAGMLTALAEGRAEAPACCGSVATRGSSGGGATATTG